ncbi:MAG: ABC transporter permease subunit, partial [bacterium]
MKPLSRIFSPRHTSRHHITWNDTVVLIGMGILLYVGLYVARRAPAFAEAPEISLSPLAIPWYALLSVRRMAAAYCLTMLFAMVYGCFAASDRRIEQVLIPLLDVLQSVPILSFLPVALLILSAVLPQKRAVELASVVLIFTSQVWHLTFAWYQSLITVPRELREAATVFRFNRWMRFKTLELPFAAVSMIWNSMMSWAGGWFFLMAAEIFTVGNRDFRLPGLGAYLHEAAGSGDIRAILWGVGALILVIVSLDQFVWCPLLAWSERFKL